MGCIWSFIICFIVSFQCNVLFFVSLLSLFFLCPPNSILSRTGKKENQDASNLTVPMTMCLFPVPFPLTPSLRPQVSSINPTVTRSLLYSVLRDAPTERGQQSRDAQLSDYPSLDYQGLYVTLVTLLDLVPLLQHGQHGEWILLIVNTTGVFQNISKSDVFRCIWTTVPIFPAYSLLTILSYYGFLINTHTHNINSSLCVCVVIFANFEACSILHVFYIIISFMGKLCVSAQFILLAKWSEFLFTDS